MDYGIWPRMAEKVGKVHHDSIASLKAAIIREWDALEPEFIIACCRGFRGRVEKVIQAQGGQIPNSC
jgi:hypothetical protein